MVELVDVIEWAYETFKSICERQTLICIEKKNDFSHAIKHTIKCRYVLYCGGGFRFSHIGFVFIETHQKKIKCSLTIYAFLNGQFFLRKTVLFQALLVPGNLKNLP